MSPGANTGVPTGAASARSWMSMCTARSMVAPASTVPTAPGWCTGGMLVRTPTGGMHAYYPATPGSEQRSWQAARAGIDFRGDGGYIIVPPSTCSIEGTTRVPGRAGQHRPRPRPRRAAAAGLPRPPPHTEPSCVWRCGSGRRCGRVPVGGVGRRPW